jgi:hypothetical protein
MVTIRRFPPPWRVDKIPGGYVVRDANGQALVWIYSRDSEADAGQGAHDMPRAKVAAYIHEIGSSRPGMGNLTR